jgi:putative tricarboxylic transport membrane protein
VRPEDPGRRPTAGSTPDAGGDTPAAGGDASAAADPAPAAADATPSPEPADSGAEPADSGAEPADSGTRLAALLLGVIAVALGCVVLVDAARIRAPAGQSFVGPAAFPIGVGILLIVTGGAVAAASIPAVRALPAKAGPRPLGRVAALLGLLIGYAIVLPRLSYVLSTAILFAGAALLFGSGHRMRTAVIGVVLAAAAFVAFGRGIGVSLPAGPWGF